MSPEDLFHEIDKLKPEMIQTLIELTRIPAIAPENGGDGETRKAEKLLEILTKIGFDKIERFDADDSRVSSGKRPNIVAYLKGEEDAQRLWIVTHLDVVPAGEEALWTITNPFEPISKEDKIFGRGCEDNGQSLVASLYAVYALKRLGLKSKHTIGLAFVADEEQGSIFGIQHLLNKNVFHGDDLIVVPDGGNEQGSFIEVSEKSLLWFRIRTVGKQTHASLPNKGLNAHRIGIQVALALDKRLHEKFSECDKFFDVPESTFEPTKKELNVESINIVPGEDVLYFDCRILPKYEVKEVIEEINHVLSEVEQKTGAAIKLEIVQKQSNPKLIDGNAKIITMLKETLKQARGFEAHVGGIGGGSCAAYFRKQRIPAALWSTVDEVAHQPNEYCKITNLVADAKVFALLMTI
ncbi:MAG TPA: M20 family metallo-hydrolase [Candidatus Sulfotelmatobacter sp.]|nr:M20 family metallo-hydrolase [Candidatus Sulfotelmatobacter sp.]